MANNGCFSRSLAVFPVSQPTRKTTKTETHIQGNSGTVGAVFFFFPQSVKKTRGARAQASAELKKLTLIWMVE